MLKIDNREKLNEIKEYTEETVKIFSEATKLKIC